MTINKNIDSARTVSSDGSAESLLIDRLLAGDELAFRELITRYNAQMLRVARAYCRRTDAVEEVVQETWLAVVQGLPRFERRSSPKAWMFRILTNRAKTRGVREARTVPTSALGAEEDGPIELERYAAPGHWSSPDSKALQTPESHMVDVQTLDKVLTAIETLPDQQRVVITFRDVQGLSSEEVCQALDISRTNQRVLLHRARHKVRKQLQAYVA